MNSSCLILQSKVKCSLCEVQPLGGACYRLTIYKQLHQYLMQNELAKIIEYPKTWFLDANKEVCLDILSLPEFKEIRKLFLLQ